MRPGYYKVKIDVPDSPNWIRRAPGRVKFCRPRPVKLGGSICHTHAISRELRNSSNG
jgi:hypothetical protein